MGDGKRKRWRERGDREEERKKEEKERREEREYETMKATTNQITFDEQYFVHEISALSSTSLSSSLFLSFSLKFGA